MKNQNDIGIVNINLKRGNNKAYTLSFFNVDALGIETPKDLMVYTSSPEGVLAYYAYIGRHCAYLWVCIFALLGLNALNIAYYFVSFEYLTYYSAVLVASGLLFTLIHAIRKNRKTNYVFRE